MVLKAIGYVRIVVDMQRMKDSKEHDSSQAKKRGSFLYVMHRVVMPAMQSKH